MDMQAYIDGMGAKRQRERAKTQMTLSGLIERLEEMPPEKEIKGLGNLDSYRGYYSDLAFEPVNTAETVAVLLERCKGAMGEVFEGYKGGDFVMGALTPIWVAYYGNTGSRLMAINDDGSIESAEGD